MPRLRFSAAAVLLLAAVAPSAAQTRAFTGLTLIDGTDRGPIANATIVVRDGRITAIGPSPRVTIPTGAEEISLNGKFVIPGLFNAHGHVNAPADLRTYAAYGVTTVYSLGGEPPEVFAARAAQTQPTLDRSRVYVAGAVVNATSPEDGRRQAQA